MNLTRNQLIGILTVVLSACVASTTYFTDTFGANVAHIIVGTAAFLNMVVGGIATILGAQSQQVRDVAAMPGIEKIQVNAQANQTLASIAVDTTQSKVAATPQAAPTVAATARG